MTSLSPVDQAFFLLETAERPMNVGVLFVLPSTGSTPGRFADHLVARMLECPVGPPFNARLKPGTFRPLLSLETDERMDARRQVHRHRLPRGTDLDQLFRKVCAIHVRLLPRDQPLWQMHVFTGLPDGRVALYFKTHHGLIDGIGFIRVVTGVVTTSKAAGKPSAIWQGLPADPKTNAARPRKPASGDAISLEGLLGSAREAGAALGDLARIFYAQSQRGLGRGPRPRGAVHGDAERAAHRAVPEPGAGTLHLPARPRADRRPPRQGQGQRRTAGGGRHRVESLPRGTRNASPTARWSPTCRSRWRTTAAPATASRSCRCRWASRGRRRPSDLPRSSAKRSR